ncbi:hypothetical protein M513_13212 [Trichuris suis]|uniref:Integrase catalytic domain-containing protein n=1 Tax=Trichuris suis TaxID=68888 RepID=A0A085LLT1_9BILA|nr:hypothetical protein M513_13212 [Trichuris suis]
MVHQKAGHPGVRRTLYFVRRRDPMILKREVARVLSECDICKSIDPAPAKWKRGRSSAEVARQLESVFYQRGAPEELLTDNDTAFRSREVNRLAEKWGTRLRFRCAYVPSGNGITERCHRTVKVIAARSKCSVQEAVHRYNLTPRDDSSAATAPANAIYRYVLKDRNELNTVPAERSTDCPYSVGDSVWVRPHAGRCDSQYDSDFVTRVISDQAVEVDGMPRHVRDLRRRNTTMDQPPCSTTQLVTNHLADDNDSESGMIRIRTRGEPVQAQPEQDQRQAKAGPRRSARIRRRRGCTLLGCLPAESSENQEDRRNGASSRQEELTPTCDLEIRGECRQ